MSCFFLNSRRFRRDDQQSFRRWKFPYTRHSRDYPSVECSDYPAYQSDAQYRHKSSLLGSRTYDGAHESQTEADRKNLRHKDLQQSPYACKEVHNQVQDG